MKSRFMRSRRTGFDIESAHGESAVAVVPGVWLSEGLSNSFLVVTDEGRVVINTGMGHEAPVHKALFDAVDDRPVRFVVVTQGHVDHVGGVDLFREPGTQLIAQSANAACQADDARIGSFRVRRSWPFWSDAIAKANTHVRARRTNAAAPPPVQSTPTPDITFDDSYAFALGGTRFELYATPGGETVDSAVVWLPDQRVAFVGNLFSALFGHIPNLVTMRGDRLRFALPFIESADRVLALEPEVLCTGHFEPIVGADLIRTEITKVRDAVAYVHDAVVSGMNAGKSVEALMAEIRLPEELDVGEGYGKVAWDVRAIWEGYAGWFHARSTTELYAVPVTDSYETVVQVAGADQLVTAAEAALTAGRPERAIHLSEMVLAADPAHPGALRTYRGAHEQLLIRCGEENFWETKWLRLQIADATKRLGEGE